DTGDLPEAFQKIQGEFAVAFDVAPRHLDVDGRWQAEVEDLTDDVRWQEVERDAGELRRQLLAQQADVVLGWLVPLGQRNHDVRVGRSDGTGVVVREIRAAAWQADIVQNRC